MADTEAVVTRFTADVTELQKGVDQAKASVADYAKDADKAATSTDHLQASAGSAATKVTLLAEAERKAAQAQQEQAKGAEQAAQSLTKEAQAAEATRQTFQRLFGELNKVSNEKRRLQQAIKDNEKQYAVLNKTITESGVKSDALTKAVAENRAEHADLSKQLGKTAAAEALLKTQVAGTSKAMIASAAAAKVAAVANVQMATSGAKLSIFQRITQGLRNFGTTARAAFTSAFASVRRGEGAISTLKKGLNDASVAVPRLGGLFRLLVSPIGLVAGAVAGLFLNLTRLDSIKTLLDGIGRGFGSILDQLAGGTLTVSSFFEAFSRGRELALEFNRLRAAQSALILGTAEERKEIEKLLIQSKDRSKTEEERVALLERAQGLEKQSVINQKAVADQAARANTQVFIEKIIAQNKLTEEQEEILRNITILRKEDLATIEKMTKISRGNLFLGEDSGAAIPLNVDDESRKQAVETSRQIIELATEEQGVIERAQARINFLREQGEQERRAAAQKALEDAKKILDAEREIQNVREGLVDESIREGLSEIEKAVFDSDKKYEEVRAKTVELFAKLAEAGKVVPQVEQAQIFGQVEAARAASEKRIREQAEVAAIKQESDAQRAIDDLLRSEGERKLQTIRDEYQKRLEENDKFVTDEVQREKNRGALLSGLNQDLADERLRQEKEANAERLKLEEETQQRQAQLLEDSLNVLGDVIAGTIGLLSERNAQEASLREERLGAIEEDFAAQLAANEQFDQSEQNRARKRASILAEQDRALAAERARIGQEEQAQKEKQSKAFIGLLLDNLQKVVEMAALEIIAQSAAKGAAVGGPVGALAGLAQGALIAVAIRTLFAGLKAAFGAYEGERLVGQRERPMFSGRDGYVRRVHKNEGILDAETNVANLPILDAMRKKRLDHFIHLHYVKPALEDQQFDVQKYLTYDPIVNINRYLNGETGGRMAQAATFPRNFDKGMVEAIMRNGERQKATNDLLAAQLEWAKKNHRHNRTWS